MKKLIMLALVIATSAAFNTVSAGGKKDKKQKAQATAQQVVQPAVLTTGSDSLSYAAGQSLTNGLIPYLERQLGVDTAYMASFIEGFNTFMQNPDDPKQKAFAAGMSIASQMNTQMLRNVETEFTDTPDSIVRPLVSRGFTDALQGDTTHFTQKQAEAFFKQKREDNKNVKNERLYGANRKAGERFLLDNGVKEGVVTQPSGLQYKVLTEGNGPVPKRSDKVLVNYEGRLIDGTVFDSSAKHGNKPASFRPTQVIPGWTEALTMMPVGSKWQLYIPYQLAYGDRKTGEITPYSTLIFDVELVGIEEAKPEQPTKVNPAIKKK